MYSCLLSNRTTITSGPKKINEVRDAISLFERRDEMTRMNTPPHAVDLEQFVCSICLETPTEPTTRLECGHKFCFGCLLRHLRRTKNCPLCRAPVKFDETIDDVTADAVNKIRRWCNAPLNPVFTRLVRCCFFFMLGLLVFMASQNLSGVAVIDLHQPNEPAAIPTSEIRVVHTETYKLIPVGRRRVPSVKLKNKI